MGKSEWFKVSCDICCHIFEPEESRIIILHQKRIDGKIRHITRGHYCEECFKKVSGNGKRN